MGNKLSQDKDFKNGWVKWNPIKYEYFQKGTLQTQARINLHFFGK